MRYFSDFGGLCDSLMNFCHKITFFLKKRINNSISWNFFITTHYHYSTFVLSHILMLIFFWFFFPKKNLAANFFRGILSFLSYIYHCWLKSYVSKLADWEKSCNHISILAHFCSKEIRIYIYIYVYTINIIYLILHIGISCRLSMTHQVSD